jgi:hypothetical protein
MFDSPFNEYTFITDNLAYILIRMKKEQGRVVLVNDNELVTPFNPAVGR